MLFYGIGLILVAFVVHLFVWKIHLPRNHTKSLLVIFLLILITGIFIFKRFENRIALWNIPGPISLSEYLQLTLLYISLALAYLNTYSAVEADSPSLLILIIIDRQGQKGLGLEMLNGQMNDELLVEPRIKDLMDGKMIYLENDKYKLTRRGLWLIRIFVLYRKLLNVGKGG